MGIWQRDWEPPGNLTLEASGIWLWKYHRTGETDSWRAQTKPCVHQEPGERSSFPIRDWVRLACERLLLSHERSQDFLASRGERFNSGPMTRLDHSKFLCNKVLLKYKRGRESLLHRHQNGAERVHPCLSLAGSYIPTSRLIMRERKCLKTQRVTPGPSSTTCILN